MCNAYSKINEFNKFTDLIFLEYAFNILLNLKTMRYFSMLSLILLLGCQAREYELVNHQVHDTEGQIGVAMGSCMQMASSGNNIKTPDKKGRIENHRRSDDSFIECSHNEFQKIEQKRLRKKELKKNN